MTCSICNDTHWVTVKIPPFVPDELKPYVGQAGLFTCPACVEQTQQPPEQGEIL